jgi:ATP-dependent DNA helicase PIF1
MIGVGLLRCIDFVMRNRTGARDSQALFGGARVVFVGDFCQLPPVCDSYAFKWDEWPMLNLCYASLTRSLRQDGDREWYEYLQRIRRAEIEYIRSNDPQTPEEITLAQYEAIMTSQDLTAKPLVLSADNAVVEELNMREFQRIESPVEMTYVAQDSLVKQIKMPGGLSMWQRMQDVQPTAADMQKVQNCWRLQNEVQIKVGARYVITFNLNKANGVYNGQTCVYEGGGMFRLLSAKFGGALVNANDLIAEMAVATQRLENVFIQRRQIALRLGYAQTIHRSQGMTLSNCLVDLRTLRCAGQYYVAMSRVRSRRDIRMMCPTNAKIRHSHEVLFFLRSNDLLEVGGGGGAICVEDDDDNDPIGEDEMMED